MFIETETTPNPAVLKFLPGRPVATPGHDMKSRQEAASSPLAQRLFALSGVTGVYLGGDFIAVTAGDAGQWPALKPDVLGAVMDHFLSGEPVILSDPDVGIGGAGEAGYGGEDAEIVEQIKVLLDEKIRPAVARDGGDIAFHSYREGVVFLEMRGACSGCPSSSATLRFGVENLIKHFVPEVTAVRQI